MTISEAETDPYHAVAYPGHSFAQTHPARLGTIAHVHAMDPAPTGRMRVLELGCGRGGNLLPMAAHRPESEFLGIDLSGESIRQAQAGAAALGLATVRFEQRDILSLDGEPGSFDYIIAHCVYSWVPDPVRERILALFGQLLAPQGVAYVSYDALPGCRFRDLARDVMLFETRDIADPLERVRAAKAALKRFAEASDPESFHGAALRQRQRQVDDLPDSVLFHDDPNPGARAFALHQVVEAAGRHGLQFPADASFPNLYGAAKGPAQQMLAAIAPDDAVRREQTLGLLIGRAFRETLFCRSDLPLRSGIGAEALRPYHLAADVIPADADGAPASPGVERFVFAEGVKLAVDLPLCKAARRLLGKAWPAGIPWPELVADAWSHKQNEIGPEPDIDREQARLDEALLAIFKTGLLDIRLDAPPLTTLVGDRPRASEVARWQASRAGEVTDLRHRTVKLDSLMVRKFVTLLDGQRDHAALCEAMNAFLTELRAKGGAEEGLPERVTEAEVVRHLADIARLGLLHG